MNKFKGILMCTDLDGTLLRSDKTLSRENAQAIEYFKSEGGRFTFITGRMYFFAREAYDIVKPNAPIGCINGGGLYDYEAQDYTWFQEISKDCAPLIDAVTDAIPKIGVQINTPNRVYFHRNNEAMESFRFFTRVPDLRCHYQEVAQPWTKIVFGDLNEKNILHAAEILAAHPLASEFDFIRSELSLYEILPKGITKATALTKLCEQLEIPLSHSVAIGDFNNDIGMIRAAGVGVAVGNALPEVKAVADYVTVTNEEHAIAHVIDAIDRGEIVFG